MAFSCVRCSWLPLQSMCDNSCYAIHPNLPAWCPSWNGTSLSSSVFWLFCCSTLACSMSRRRSSGFCLHPAWPEWQISLARTDWQCLASFRTFIVINLTTDLSDVPNWSLIEGTSARFAWRDRMQTKENGMVKPTLRMTCPARGGQSMDGPMGHWKGPWWVAGTRACTFRTTCALQCLQSETRNTKHTWRKNRFASPSDPNELRRTRKTFSSSNMGAQFRRSTGSTLVSPCMAVFIPKSPHTLCLSRTHLLHLHLVLALTLCT